MGVLTTADKTGLALLCEALAEYLEARQVIADAGALTYESETKQGGVMIRAHPAAALASDAFRRAVAVAKEFGLTPAARARVEAEPETDADPLEEFLGRSRRAGRG
jgi:P27 family predicted phage terminase small subunit